MNIGLLSTLRTQIFDFHRGMASNYAAALKNVIALHVNGMDGEKEKQQSFFLSSKRGLEDKLYVGNIHRIENRLYWKDEELAEDDQIINVVVMTGPVTRDGGACSYGTKELRDQVIYANTIPQVVGHVFYVNTPGGEAACRNDYEQLIDDCRKYGKPVVAFVDGLCASSGVNFASRADRVIVMNAHDEFGCIGSMAAFWATPDGAIDRDGSRYVEIVGEDCPAKNDWYIEAAKGDYEKLQAQLNKSTQEFHKSVKENRPLTEDWMLTGEVFEAQQVIPALVDEIGDFNRAIECVFQLADGTLKPAREVEVVDEPEADAPDAVDEPENEPAGEPAGETTGTVEEQTLTPKNDNVMKEEEKKAQEAVAAEAPETIETHAADESAQEDPAPAADPEPEPEPAPAQEEPTAPETPAEEPLTEEPAAPEAPTSEGTVAEAQAELAKATDALHSAEALVEQRDKTIAEMQSVIDTKTEAFATQTEAFASLKESFDKQSKQLADALALADENTKTIAEQTATIDKLTKQVAELKAEVKELSEKPTPMVTAESGVPKDNATGEAPKYEGAVKSEINADDSIDDIRAKLRAKDEKQKTYRH